MKQAVKKGSALAVFWCVVLCFAVASCPRSQREEGETLLSFTAAGEMRPRAGTTLLYEEGEDVFKNVKSLFNERDLVLADLAGALEFGCQPLARDEVYRWKAEWLDRLAASNIRVINLADDHAADCGREALQKSSEFLMAEGFYYLGAGTTQKEAQTPVYITEKGITVSLLSFLLESPPGLDPCEECTGPSMYDRQALIKGLGEMKERSDFQIVIFHFEEKALPGLSNKEVLMTRQAIDFGADLVLGYGARSAGGLYRVRGKWAVTGMGMFTGMPVKKADKAADGILLCAEFRKSSISNLRVLPVSLKAGRPLPLRGESGRGVLERLVNRSGPEVGANSKIIGDILYLK